MNIYIIYYLCMLLWYIYIRIYISSSSSFTAYRVQRVYTGAAHAHRTERPQTKSSLGAATSPPRCCPIWQKCCPSLQPELHWSYNQSCRSAAIRRCYTGLLHLGADLFRSVSLFSDLMLSHRSCYGFQRLKLSISQTDLPWFHLEPLIWRTPSCLYLHPSTSGLFSAATIWA